MKGWNRKLSFKGLSYVLLTSVCMQLLPLGVVAQAPQRDIQIMEFYNEEWYPLASLDATLEKFPSGSGADLFTVLGSTPEIRAAETMIFEPVINETLELLNQPGKWKSLPMPQQKWMKFAQALNAGGGTGTLLITGMYQRPMIASGELYWCQLKQPLSVRGKQIFQQILVLEKLLEYKAYHLKDVQVAKPFENRNNQIAQAYSGDVTNIPMKKVDMGGAIVEIPDPAKQAALIRKYEKLKMNSFQEEFNLRFNNWKTAMAALAKAAKESSDLLVETSFGEELTGNDKQLIVFLADLQARAIETSASLRETASKLIGVAEMARLVREANKAALAQLEPYIQ
ncbi:MAG: hypothetical protein J7578_22560 [Chitinophagaceae bacterium]|nr:hypothetical protein [Chitinophagaceae bacterium]